MRSQRSAVSVQSVSQSVRHRNNRSRRRSESIRVEDVEWGHRNDRRRQRNKLSQNEETHGCMHSVCGKRGNDALPGTQPISATQELVAGQRQEQQLQRLLLRYGSGSNDDKINGVFGESETSAASVAELDAGPESNGSFAPSELSSQTLRESPCSTFNPVQKVL